MAHSTAKIIAAFLAGAAAGASLGILLAPEKGEQTREKLKTTFDDLSDKGKKVYDNYKKKQAEEEEE